MKPVLLSIFCSILILNACSTIEKTQKAYEPSMWSTSDPLTIPYNIRLAQFEKGNLVINPSFENGSVLAGSPAKTFNIAGMVDAMVIIPNERYRKKFHEFAHRYQINKVNVFAAAAIEAKT